MRIYNEKKTTIKPGSSTVYKKWMGEPNSPNHIDSEVNMTNKRTQRYFKQTSGRYNKYGKTTNALTQPGTQKPVGKVPIVKLPQQPGDTPAHDYDGWWLSVNVDNLNMMCSPDGTSVWDMDVGQCTPVS
jgi:hypothetical protein